MDPAREATVRTEPLPYLDTFVCAAERGSFTAAARELGLSQAAVSQRVQCLETLLRTPLFRRAGGRVSLTAAGRKLHEYASRILDLTAEAWGAVTGSPVEVTGELLLAASSVPGHHHLPRALGEYRKRYPLVQVRASVSDTEAVFRRVEEGEVSLGFVGGPGGPHLESRPFATDELVLVVPKGHPWWRKRRLRPADLVAQPFIQRERGSGSRQCFEQALERAGTAVSALNVVLELGSSEAVKAAVLDGAGVAVLSRLAVRGEVKAGMLKPVAIDGLTCARDIFVVWDRRRVLPAPARLFLTFVLPGGPRPDP
jgi:DNA-binding transcriptional LysR family regulator